MAIRAFMIHATEDKERFVVGFATRLREKGVDAWVDQWEIKPGDSLVQKVFNEGLDKSDVVIAVLSKFSIERPWVREELDASIVNRIQRKAKIIPVVLDGLADHEVPQALRATLHVKIDNLNEYDAAFEQIIGAIYGHSFKPPLGNPPAYMQTKIDLVPGLNKVDSIVLKLVGDLAVEQNSTVIHPDTIVEMAADLGIGTEAATDSLFVLDRRNYVGAETALQGDIILLQTTVAGLEAYAQTYVPDYGVLVKAVGLRLVNHQDEASEDIAHCLNCPHLLVRHILDTFEYRRMVELVRFNDDGSRVLSVSPDLKRMFS